jgi:hypothetical protein
MLVASTLFPFSTLAQMLGPQPTAQAGLTTLASALLPAGVLSFLVLCRVAALSLPLWSGLARGVQKAAPYVLAMLAALYLAALVPAVAADRAYEQYLSGMLTNEVEAWPYTR